MTRKERIAVRNQRRYDRMTAERDLRYRGPLSYRAFKILGWACIVCSQVVVLLTLESKLDPTMTAVLQSPISALNNAAELALPFLLLANFALILNHSEGYGGQIRKYAILNVLVIALSVFLFSRYAVGTVAIVTQDRAQARALLQELIRDGSGKGYVDYNIFVDLLLCTVLMYFLNHRPQKLFVGKKLIIFRCFAALPVGYEVVSIALKLASSYGDLALPLWIFPFLTVKPPITFLVFIVMAVFIKTRELRFRRNGRTHGEYLDFLKTNRNSWDFSVFTAWTLVVAGVVDLLIAIVFILADNGLAVDYESTPFAELYRHAAAMDLGESVPLLLLAPIMLLFSYTRVHKNKTFDLLIPVIGVAAIVITYLEGLYQFFLMLPDMIGPPMEAFLTEYGPIIEMLTAGLPGLTG